MISLALLAHAVDKQTSKWSRTDSAVILSWVFLYPALAVNTLHSASVKLRDLDILGDLDLRYVGACALLQAHKMWMAREGVHAASQLAQGWSA